MTKFVPYLAEEAMERDAAALLVEYAQRRRLVIEPPIPIDDIVEKHLRLGIEFDDTHKHVGVPRPRLEPDILGMLYFDEGRIVIDESLDPEENPAKEGRYRSTLAHEGAHWCLHRHLFAKNTAQATMFDIETTPPLVCRSSQAKERVEWQADFYASCLLMPRTEVFSAWDRMFSDHKQRILQSRASVNHPFVEIPRIECRLGCLDYFETDDNALDRFARPLAELFLVSSMAMRIRLERLGLLLREVPHQPTLTSCG